MPLIISGGGSASTVTWANVIGKPSEYDAGSIKSVTVDDTDKANEKVLQYNSTSGNLEYVAMSAGSGDIVTYENLNTNGDVGTGSAQVAAGDHNHTGTYEPVLNANQKRTITVGTDDPTGGSDGDIYIKYTA